MLPEKKRHILTGFGNDVVPGQTPQAVTDGSHLNSAINNFAVVLNVPGSSRIFFFFSVSGVNCLLLACLVMILSPINDDVD